MPNTKGEFLIVNKSKKALFYFVGFFPAEVAFDAFDFGVVDEGVGVVFEDFQKLGNLTAVDDGDDGGGGFACEHTVGVHDGGAVFELLGDVPTEGVGVLGDDMECHGVTVVAEQKAYAFFKDVHLHDGEEHASQVAVNEIGAADDDIAHDTDDTFNIHVAVFFVEHGGNDIGAACGKPKANHNARADA